MSSSNGGAEQGHYLDLGFVTRDRGTDEEGLRTVPINLHQNAHSTLARTPVCTHQISGGNTQRDISSLQATGSTEAHDTGQGQISVLTSEP
jgi:hypothetical protein